MCCNICRFVMFVWLYSCFIAVYFVHFKNNAAFIDNSKMHKNVQTRTIDYIYSVLYLLTRLSQIYLRNNNFTIQFLLLFF